MVDAEAVNKSFASFFLFLFVLVSSITNIEMFSFWYPLPNISLYGDSLEIFPLIKCANCDK